MSYVQEVAREALRSAHTDLFKARRNLVLVAGVLALLHLLTVYPYLEASREIVGVEASMAENDRLLTQLEPAIERLKQASDSAGSQLGDLLFSVTGEMIADFAELRARVAQAMQGDPSGPPPDFPQDQMQQMPLAQQMPPLGPQLPPLGSPNDPAQMPIGQQMGIPPIRQATPNAPGIVLPLEPLDELGPILSALAANEPGAEDRLTDYARQNIVANAYSRAQREWSEQIRPAYIDALVAIERQARATAENAPRSAAQTASALVSAASEIAEQRTVVEAIEITHDSGIDDAFTSDWWRTVEGKGAYADAIGDRIAQQMQSIAATAESPSAAIRKTLALQETLRDDLRSQQEALESQFAEQRKQLASLSGAASVVPVDLASFIGLFPLVIGLVMGFMMLRVGQARREGAQATADLAGAAPDDAETRDWLAQRVLGGSNMRGPLATTGLIAIGALAWIGLAVTQVKASMIDPPLTAAVSGTLAALLVLVAAVWDGVAIRRLAGLLHR